MRIGVEGNQGSRNWSRSVAASLHRVPALCYLRHWCGASHSTKLYEKSRHVITDCVPARLPAYGDQGSEPRDPASRSGVHAPSGLSRYCASPMNARPPSRPMDISGRKLSRIKTGGAFCPTFSMNSLPVLPSEGESMTLATTRLPVFLLHPAEGRRESSRLPVLS